MSGANLTYRGVSGTLIKYINSTFETALTGSAPANKTRLRRLKENVCTKISATAPGNRADDYPNSIGDYCIHFNASGVFQAIYVCTNITFTTGEVSAVTWTVLSITSS